MKTLVLALCIASLFSFSCKTRSEKPTSSVPLQTLNSKTDAEKYLEPLRSSEVPFQLYRLKMNDPTNLNFSPLSLKMAFQMIYPGAVGKTQKTLEEAFGFTPSPTNRFQSELELAARFQDPHGSTQLAIGNSIWVKNRGDLLPSFDSALKALGVISRPLNLKALNEWVKESTRGKIGPLFDSLDPKTQLIAVNTLYLKAEWVSPFKADRTVPGKFESSPSGVVVVPMMRQSQSYKYYEDPIAQWIELPYRDSPLVMNLVLPRKRFDLRSIETQLSSTSLKTALAGMKEEMVDLVLPKFKIESKQSMKSLLTDAGYGSWFGAEDWMGISKQKYALSEVLQATSLEVNEKGTEAAAATALMMEATSLPPILKKKFYCDQPFLFFLRNSKTGEIYFMGRIYSPSPVNHS